LDVLKYGSKMLLNDAAGSQPDAPRLPDLKLLLAAIPKIVRRMGLSCFLQGLPA
jgi:hypothetical protein